VYSGCEVKKVNDDEHARSPSWCHSIGRVGSISSMDDADAAIVGVTSLDSQSTTNLAEFS